MTGGGTMTFGTGPFGLADNDALAQANGQLTSSRYLQADGTPKQTADGTGAFEGMNDALQRALILLAYGVELPDIIGADFEARMRADCAKALELLTDGPSPVLELVDVIAVDNGTSLTATQVKVRPLPDGSVRTLQPFR